MAENNHANGNNIEHVNSNHRKFLIITIIAVIFLVAIILFVNSSPSKSLVKEALEMIENNDFTELESLYSEELFEESYEFRITTYSNLYDITKLPNSRNGIKSLDYEITKETIWKQGDSENKLDDFHFFTFVMDYDDFELLVFDATGNSIEALAHYVIDYDVEFKDGTKEEGMSFRIELVKIDGEWFLIDIDP